MGPTTTLKCKLELSSDPWDLLSLVGSSHLSPHLLLEHLGGGSHHEEGAERDEPDDHLRLRCQDLLQCHHLAHLWLALLDLWLSYFGKGPLLVSKYLCQPSFRHSWKKKYFFRVLKFQIKISKNSIVPVSSKVFLWPNFFWSSEYFLSFFGYCPCFVFWIFQNFCYCTFCVFLGFFISSPKTGHYALVFSRH